MKTSTKEELERIRKGTETWQNVVKILASSDLAEPGKRNIRFSFSGAKMSGNIERLPRPQGGVILRIWTNSAGGEQKIYIPSDLFMPIREALLTAEAIF